MKPEDLGKLLEDSEHEILGGKRIGVLGATPTAAFVIEALSRLGLIFAVTAIYSDDDNCPIDRIGGIAVRRLSNLAQDEPAAIVVASDTEKESLIRDALPHIVGAPKLIIAGYGHHEFRDPLFDDIRSQLLVPSLANGYPNSLIHLFQCVRNAVHLGLQGVVVELGMFKGGTTMFLSLAIERLGATWPVLGFDTFGGFPPRRSPLDMYDNPDCVFTNFEAVRAYLSGRNVEIISGDIARTCGRLEDEDVVVAFVDTDNFTPTAAALQILRERTVLHGAIVFDHFTGTDRFRYTLGERLAASTLLDDHRYFNLHGTGVFIRQK